MKRICSVETERRENGDDMREKEEEVITEV